MSGHSVVVTDNVESPTALLNVLKQLVGKLKFDELIEIYPNTWRGTNKNSDFLVEMCIIPVLDVRYPIVFSFAIAEREMDLDKRHMFPINDFFSDIQYVLDALKWEAKNIWYFDDVPD